MATLFRLVASGNLDTTQAQFVFEEIAGKTYLQFGLLTADNRRHFESVISGGRIGFFQSDSEVANARIIADYDAANGVEVDSIPSALRVGSDYQTKWTQARPGRDGTGDGDSETPLDVTLVRKVQIDGLEEHTLVFEYNIGSGGRPGRYWGAKWYGSIADLEAGTPELAATRTPINVSITPAELAETEGLHFFHLSFTPQFEGDHYLAFVLDPDAESPEPVRPTVGTFIVDGNNDAIVDSSGNFVISTSGEVWNYEVDASGYQEVDGAGNRIVEITNG